MGKKRVVCYIEPELLEKVKGLDFNKFADSDGIAVRNVVREFAQIKLYVG